MISINIKNHPYIKDISFTIFPSAIVNIIGPNNSGKSLLLKEITTLTDYIEINQDSYPITYIDHKNKLGENYTIEKQILKWAKKFDTKTLIDATIKYFNLKNIKHKKVKFLSNGQKKILLYAKLLLSGANTWVIENPFSELDLNNRQKIEELIKTKSNNFGIIIISSYEKIDNVININLSDWD